MLHSYHCLCAPATQPKNFNEDINGILDDVFAKKGKKLITQLKGMKIVVPEKSSTIDWMINKIQAAVQYDRAVTAEMAFHNCYIRVDYEPEQGFLLIVKRLLDGTVSVRSYSVF